MLLAEQWPNAVLTGIDQSPDMLSRARDRVPCARFLEGDIGRFRATDSPQLILANASLHWVANHASLFPALLEQLDSHGVLAVQMPNTLPEPSHQLMNAIASRDSFAQHLENLDTPREPLLSMSSYYDALAPHCDMINVWETLYYHVLDGPEDILTWFASTGLKPYLDQLPEHKRSDFCSQYISEVAFQYPQQNDGKTLLRLPRVFILARRSD